MAKDAKPVKNSKAASKGILGKILKGIIWVFVHFGLWVPFLYAVLGVVLYFVYDFNPFDGSNNAILYSIGFALCCVIAVIITIRKIIIKPIKKLFKRFHKEEDTKKPQRKKKEQPQKEKPSAGDSHSSKTKDKGSENKNKSTQNKDNHKNDKNAEPDKTDGGSGLTELEKELHNGSEHETPKIYYSTVEPDTLIHEYSDRFEVFKVIDDRKYLSKIEYKDDGTR